MAILRAKEIAKMGRKEIEEKFKELKKELVKAGLGSKRSSKLNPKEIRRTIARLLTQRKINSIKINKEKIKGAKK